MTLTTLRIFFLLLCSSAGWALSQLQPDWAARSWMGVGVGICFGTLLIGIDLLLKGFSLRGFSAATFGLFLGSLIAWLIEKSGLFESAFQNDERVRFVATLCIYLGFSYLGMMLAMRGKDEFNLIVPYVRFKRVEEPSQPIVVDTSVIIDGRIAEIMDTGFIDGTLVIPRFVLKELQYIADSADAMKRGRGRRGLDILAKIQQNPRVGVRIHEEDFPDIAEVDAKLVHLAKIISAKIITNDYNLNKVAVLESVPVLNINDLATALRAAALPGDELSVRIVKEGKESDQGLAYMPDGTMIVVNQSRRLIGQQIIVVVTGALQTSAGRMIFAEVK
ncbi:MAG: twitching motility protein PilT [Verrucomicrobiae bacterium]|nr:twitching motility protein PilT [Verrucomicrobiae bacterium]